MSNLIPQNSSPGLEKSSGQNIPIIVVTGEGHIYVPGPAIIKIERPPDDPAQELLRAFVKQKTSELEKESAKEELETTDYRVEAGETVKGRGNRLRYLGGKAASGIVRGFGEVWKTIKRFLPGGGGKE